MTQHFVVRELLSLAAAGALDPVEQRLVDEHLPGCAACRAEWNEWTLLAGALKERPAPQAPPELLLQTRRLLQAASSKGHGESWLLPALLVVSCWTVVFLDWCLVRFIGIPLACWLDIPAAAIWATYIGGTWLATALAAALLIKHAHQEGKAL
jgi:predicted anti-sigma-YlaC factor YlaD